MTRRRTLSGTQVFDRQRLLQQGVQTRNGGFQLDTRLALQSQTHVIHCTTADLLPTEQLLFSGDPRLNAPCASVLGERLSVGCGNDFVEVEIRANTSYHLALAVDVNAKTVTTYLNNAPIGILPLHTPLTSEANLLGLGADPLALGSQSDKRGFSGWIHSYRLFDAALPAAEIAQLYNAGRAELWVLPASAKERSAGRCVAEYLPQNLVVDHAQISMWLDSAPQLPDSRGRLRPLCNSCQGHDLRVLGTPQICIPQLVQQWQRLQPMTLDGSTALSGAKVPPQIVEGAIRITKNEQMKSYGGGLSFAKIIQTELGDDIRYSFEARASEPMNILLGLSDQGDLWHLSESALIQEWTKFTHVYKNTDHPVNQFYILKCYEDTLPGTFDIRNITIKIHRK